MKEIQTCVKDKDIHFVLNGERVLKTISRQNLKSKSPTKKRKKIDFDHSSESEDLVEMVM